MGAVAHGECQVCGSKAPVELAARVVALEEFIRMEVRKMEMQANIMRDARRTGGWEGAEKVAMAFERAAIRHREMLS